MCTAVIQILFLTEKSQIFLTKSLEMELIVVPILSIFSPPTWLSESILTCLF